MMVMNNMLESLLRRIDSVLGLTSLPLVLWLLYVMVFFLAITIYVELLKKPSSLPYRVNKKQRFSHLILVLLGSSSCLSLLAFIVSYMKGYYYGFHVVLGLISLLIFSLISSMFWNSSMYDKKVEFVKRLVVHLSAVTIIFFVSARWLIRGVDSEETSSDTLNIYYNGYFRYSMHAGWYDLAPVDSIIKVILLRIGGNNDPFSPVETFLISFASGLFLYIVVYIYVKSKPSISYLIPLIPAILSIHPYAFLPGAYVTPTNIAVALALASLTLYMLSTQTSSKAHLITLNALFATSLLAHPFSLTVLIFIAICLITKYLNGLLRTHDLSFFLSASTLWFIKTVYTATMHGIASIWNSVLNGILHVWYRETLIVFRNPWYPEIPRISIASFTASLGIIGGIAVVVLLFMLRGRTINPRWIGFSIILFTGFTGLSSLLASLGGQSRYILVPFASLFSFVVLIYGEVRGVSPALKALIAIAAILTMLSPNFMPDQYSFPMAAKVSDRTMFEILRSLFEKLDPTFVINRFQGTSSMRLYIVQQSEFIRNMGEAGLIVDKLILSGIVEARSYWDFVGRGPFDAIQDTHECPMYSIIWDSSFVKVLLSWITP